jgi:hypothetical protein
MLPGGVVPLPWNGDTVHTVRYTRITVVFYTSTGRAMARAPFSLCDRPGPCVGLVKAGARCLSGEKHQLSMYVEN